MNSRRKEEDAPSFLKSSKPSLMMQLLVQAKQVSKNSRYSISWQKSCSFFPQSTHCTSEMSAYQMLSKARVGDI